MCCASSDAQSGVVLLSGAGGFLSVQSAATASLKPLIKELKKEGGGEQRRSARFEAETKPGENMV